MRAIRRFIFVCGVLMGIAHPAMARVDIDINLSLFPELVPVPGYPVYYAPQQDINFFFYDGMYWVYDDDNWYMSNWYNGPWEYVDPEFVPVYVLRVPVRYYRRPPQYFYGWREDAPPRWGDRWGNDWERHHSGWDRWDRRQVPKPAPLPTYQRQYTGDRYPRVIEQQREIRDQNYRYQPRNAEVRKHYQPSAERTEQHSPIQNSPAQHSPVQPSPIQQRVPDQRPPQHYGPPNNSPRDDRDSRPSASQDRSDNHQRIEHDRATQQRSAPVVQHEQPAPRPQMPPQMQDRRSPNNPQQNPERGRDDNRGNERDRHDDGDKHDR